MPGRTWPAGGAITASCPRTCACCTVPLKRSSWRSPREQSREHPSQHRQHRRGRVPAGQPLAARQRQLPGPPGHGAGTL
ncbi:hypothetical protein ACFFX0_04035 [Citricoccus parietis]|uniref:Uncharacterized protein n=1 Tax=Citricoccus parietis TaxID=592307 RepID=A0ABV5FUR9_9MICC